MKANVSKTEKPVMDVRLVYFNEAKNVKLSSVGKAHREDAKELREVAKYVIEIWHDVKELKTFLKTIKKNGFKQEVALEMIKGRIEELSTPAPEKNPVTKNSKEPETHHKHKVGDIHKNGKWVWKEYMPGKFDWRAISKK